MARSKTIYICQQCSYESPKWMGKCPECGEWNSFVESIPEVRLSSGSKARVKQAQVLSKIPAKSTKRVDTKLGELDRVLGGGFAPGQAVLLAGEPGIGKSTLLLQIADVVANALYVTGEESLSQIKIRADRLKVAGANLYVFEETNVDNVVASIEAHLKDHSAGVIMVDSIQTMYTEDLSGVPGSVGQVRETSLRLIHLAKRAHVPLIMTGHVTKGGSVAGPATLAHMVDTVLWFEGDKNANLRILRAIKNRFGSVDEIGLFAMGEHGLIEVGDPTALFISKDSPKGVPGAAYTCTVEGTRPFIIEIQALVTPTNLPVPRRVVHGYDQRRLELLLAVLAKHCGIGVSDRDVFVNVVGGIKVTEPAADLAVAMAVASSHKNKPLPEKFVFIGEVGLLGELRRTTLQDRRAKHAQRQGYTNVISSTTIKTLHAVIVKALK
ncbi:DNA repair protein RadA [Candidatus Woesebacteria bacterium RIFCSPHIGHO2_01_FULL_41_10]|uniref:DNA repair protein RadA n=1 Tax=Candidatus Woesebacteria bacterium RIFCSPHIGHO2_01_FULL_41_10 TaxID=1802500 RepID=A0A1F7YPS5_9BACT|nr:MAG: DNA repair protein RadA [Candidatus Woesebacteria bacterium RIFCSPHIGHO2_01_FULL_41_10]